MKSQSRVRFHFRDQMAPFAQYNVQTDELLMTIIRQVLKPLRNQWP